MIANCGARYDARWRRTDGWENWYRHVGYDWDRVIVGQTDAAKYKQHRGQSVSVAVIAREHSEIPGTCSSNLFVVVRL